MEPLHDNRFTLLQAIRCHPDKGGEEKIFRLVFAKYKEAERREKDGVVGGGAPSGGSGSTASGGSGAPAPSNRTNGAPRGRNNAPPREGPRKQDSSDDVRADYRRASSTPFTDKSKPEAYNYRHQQAFNRAGGRVGAPKDAGPFFGFPMPSSYSPGGAEARAEREETQKQQQRQEERQKKEGFVRDWATRNPLSGGNPSSSSGAPGTGSAPGGMVDIDAAMDRLRQRAGRTGAAQQREKGRGEGGGKGKGSSDKEGIRGSTDRHKRCSTPDLMYLLSVT